MLVLTRRLHERILIGDDVVIEVAWIGGDRVRIAILAPPETRVDREEVRERIVRDGPDRPCPPTAIDRLNDRLAEVIRERDEALARLSRPGRQFNEDGEVL